jgi:hypothetical protein
MFYVGRKYLGSPGTCSLCSSPLNFPLLFRIVLFLHAYDMRRPLGSLPRQIGCFLAHCPVSLSYSIPLPHTRQFPRHIIFDKASMVMVRQGVGAQQILLGKIATATNFREALENGKHYSPSHGQDVA